MERKKSIDANGELQTNSRGLWVPNIFEHRAADKIISFLKCQRYDKLYDEFKYLADGLYALSHHPDNNTETVQPFEIKNDLLLFLNQTKKFKENISQLKYFKEDIMGQYCINLGLSVVDFIDPEKRDRGLLLYDIDAPESPFMHHLNALISAIEGSYNYVETPKKQNPKISNITYAIVNFCKQHNLPSSHNSVKFQTLLDIIFDYLELDKCTSSERFIREANTILNNKNQSEHDK